MGADLHIHVLTDEFTEEHLKAFQSNTLGTKWFNPGYNKQFEKENNCNLLSMCSATPSVHVGECSFLKAALFEDNDTFIPDPLGEISDLIGEDLPIITDELIEKAKSALDMENRTQYSMNSADNIIKFLEDHKGDRAFTIAW